MATRHHHLALVLALSFGEGCQRGCLTTWLAEHGVGATDPLRVEPASPGAGGHAPRGSSRPGLDLGGVDCVSGLARCRAGHVEVSAAGHVPSPCTAPKEHPEACTCPWEQAGSCASTCVQDDLEIVAAPDVAHAQLCYESALLLRAPTAAETADVTVCDDESVACEGDRVRVCPRRGQPGTVLGVCIHGCASGVGLEVEDVTEPAPGDTVRVSGAAVILCRRDHAERR